MGKVEKVSQRASTSCEPCTKRKVKCDKTIPCAQCVKRGAECSVAPHVPRHKGLKKKPRSPNPALAVGTSAQDKDALIGVLQARIALLESILKTNGLSNESPSNAVAPPFLLPFPIPDPFAVDATGTLSSLDDVEASLALENLARSTPNHSSQLDVSPLQPFTNALASTSNLQNLARTQTKSIYTPIGLDELDELE